MKKFVLWGVGILVALIALGAALPETEESEVGRRTAEAGDEEPQREEAAAPAPMLETTARELFAAYDANEAAAQQRFGERPLRVSGTVASVQLDMFDKAVVHLDTGQMYMEAQASLADDAQDQAAALSKGEEISLECAEGVSEVIGTPMLRDCRLAR